MKRFFSIDLPGTPEVFPLSPEETHHALRVLRLNNGEEISVFNGKGTVATGLLKVGHRRKAYIDILSIHQEAQSPKNCILGVSIPENRDALSDAIRGAIEIGVSEIYLLMTHFCGYRKSGDATKYMNRFQSVMISAAKQCGRSWLPILREPMGLDPFFSNLPSGMPVYVGYEPSLPESRINPEMSQEVCNGFCWVVGPEGGWSSEDRNTLEKWNPLRIRLGHYTMTTQIAAVAGLAFLKTRFSNWE